METERPNYSLVTVISGSKPRRRKPIGTPSKTNKNVSSFYHSIGFVLVLGQFFTLMPVSGILGAEPSQIRFRWLSFKVFYTLLGVSGCLVTVIFQCMNFFKHGKQLDDIVNIIFFLSSAISSLICMKLSYNWFTFNQQWFDVEKAMRRCPFQPNLARRFKITTAIIMILALVEHLLSILRTVHESNKCPIAQTDPYKSYFGLSISHAFRFIDFNYWLVVYMQMAHIVATFVWNYTDLLIILMCGALAERFRQLNQKVQYEQIKNERFWKDTREHYTRLSTLCKHLDNAISHIVTISFGNNLFFICIQLFNTLKPIRGLFQTAYFVYSFGFLLGRTAALSVYCCWINDESKHILTYLFVVPSEHFGVETNRLIQQICYCPVVITGSNYFAVTRGLCLQIAGAIITFELILVQLGPMLLKTDQEYEPFCIT